ncbi:hypothetical protein GOP47_0022351 [Adiantum capillus-veneris]|uniref:Uncharacterized protein n=1 Tax=Adiantum capillus-veneris TaxID=13818 RepID=A0A9D4U6A7_ADICA|nr:hypothetical protein GOP47_0022351 [Adiantum capillus-veneris]
MYDPLHHEDMEQKTVLVVDEQICEDVVDDGSVDYRGRLATKAKTGAWKAAPLIFGTEICERMASLGLQRNLVTYFVNKMNIDKPTAAVMVSNFGGTLYLTPFLGGFLADAYMGRFWAISVFASIQVFGMVLLTLSAALKSLRPSPCAPSGSACAAAHGVQLAVLYTALFLIALGNGGIKPNVSSFGADQFDEHDNKERKHMPSFFNWFYFIISIGSLISVTVFVYIQDNVSFGWGFGIPAGLMAIAIAVFFAGSSLYRYKLPSGSSLTHIMQVAVAAARKQNLPLPADKETLFEEEIAREVYTPRKKLPHSNQFMFLDKAAVLTGDEVEDLDRQWYLCTVTQVEEVKMLLRVLPIWASTSFVWTTLTQMETFSVLEGATLDRHVGKSFFFPPASLAVFELANVLIILPLYDRFLVPMMRKVTGLERGISTLQRIGTGIVFSMLAMVVAGFVELKRIRIAKENGLLDLPKETVPMSIFWLVPQYFFRGSTELFTQIGQLEFFYNEVPNSIRSLGTALYLSTIAVGSFLSSALVTAINHATGHGGISNLQKLSKLSKQTSSCDMLLILPFGKGCCSSKNIGR